MTIKILSTNWYCQCRISIYSSPKRKLDKKRLVLVVNIDDSCYTWKTFQLDYEGPL